MLIFQNNSGLLFIECVEYVLSLICVVSSINGILRLYKIRDEMYIRKRSIYIILGMNMPLILLIISLNIGLCARIHNYPIIEFVTDLLSVLCWWIFVYFFNIKSWIMYYKQKWIYFALKFKWKKMLHSGYTNNDNWFIKNNHKWGNRLYVSKIFAIFYLIGLSLGIIGSILDYFQHLHSSIASAFISIPFLISTIICIIIVWKTERSSSKENDIFHIHWESKIISIILLSFITTYLIFVYLSYDNLNRINDEKIIYLSFTPLFVIFPTILIHISTYIIRAKNRHPFASDNKNRKRRLRSFSGSRSVKPITLEQVLSNEKSVHHFMVYLSKELRKNIAHFAMFTKTDCPLNANIIVSDL